MGGSDRKDTEEEIRAAIEEATMLEVTLLERKPRRAVHDRVHRDDGRPARHDARHDPRLLGARVLDRRAGRRAALARISEALINTAGGLIAAIIGIVAYNYFTTKVDSFTYNIDEAAATMVQTLAHKSAVAAR